MKIYGGMDVQIYFFLTSARVGDVWFASCPGHFTLGERSPLYLLFRKLDGPQRQSGQFDHQVKMTEVLKW
jgi:hypothetical protein